jgi:hypothetical protein
MMRRALQILLTLGAAALIATAASAAFEPANRSTPSAWNWEIKDGKRVPKAERKVDADGTAREEVRRGNCVSVTEKLPDGTIKKSDHC